MKPLLRVIVSPWTLLLLCAPLKICRAECDYVECNSTDTETLTTTTTTTVTFESRPDCLISVGNNTSENGSIADLTPGGVHQIFFSCLNCCGEVTTKPERVINLHVTNITTSSMLVAWTEPAGNRSLYRVQWTIGEDSQSENTSDPFKTIAHLTAGVGYDIAVTVLADDVLTEGEAATTSQYTKPQNVRNLSVTETTTSSVFVNWTEPEGNKSFYRVQWTREGVNETVNVTETQFNVTELTAGVQYEISVTAMAGDGLTGGQSAAVTQYTRPEAVANLNVTETTTSSLFVSWSEPAGNKSFYRVQWTPEGVNMTVNVTETQFNVTELTAGVQYEISVTAMAGDGLTGGQSAAVTQYTRPEAVANLNVTETTTSSLFVSWSEPAGNKSFYRVQWTPEGVNMTVNVTETQFNVTELTAGVQYEISVTAMAGDGLTGGQSAAVTQYTRPEAVTNLNVTETTTSSLFVNWTEPEGNKSFYRVQWTREGVNLTVNVTETQFNVTELTAGVQYEISVTAMAGDGLTGGQSAAVTQYTRPEAVANLNVTETTTSSLFVSWSEPAGNRSFYRVQWTREGASETVNVTETQFNITGLTAGVQYEISVTAMAGDGLTGGQSTTVRYTEPGQIGNPTVVVNTSSISLNWTRPPGEVFKYRVKWNNSEELETQETFAMLPDLVPGTTYTITVLAVNGDNQIGEPRTFTSVTKPALVRSLIVEGTTTSSVSLHWIEPEGNATSYRVQWVGGEVTDHNATTETSFTINDLIPGTLYSIRVAAVAVDQGEVTTITAYTVPEQPEIIPITAQTDNVNIRWTLANGNFGHYMVNVSNEELPYFHSITTTNTTAHFTDLSPGRAFDVTVTAVAGLVSNTSHLSSFATFPTPPGSIVISQKTNSSLFLEWATPARMDGAPNVSYNITYQTGGGEVQTQSATINNKELVMLSSGRLYNITLETVGPQNLRSTVVHVWAFTRPNPVLNPVASPKSTTSVEVTWSYPQGVQTNYTYLVQTSNATGALITTTVSSNSTVVSNLEPGTRYNISVKTIAAAGTESTGEETYSYTMPKAVTNLTAEYENTTAVRLVWRQQTDYKPFYSYLVTVRQNGLVDQNVSTTMEAYTFFGLTSGALYMFDVWTVVEGVSSTESSTLIYTYPATVSNIAVVGTTTNLSVSWTPASGQVDSYFILLFRDDQLQGSRQNLNADTDNHLFVNLEPDVRYCVLLVTNSGSLQSNSSTVCNATFPNPPGPIRVESQTVESITFSWLSPLDHQYNFSVSTFNGSYLTENNSFLLDGLQSGSPYNISVVTVGVLGYESAAVTAAGYTRPYPASMLRATEITTDAVTLVWEQRESKSYYSYVVATRNSSMLVNTTVLNTTFTITGLVPGSNYSFTVFTMTTHGTHAESVTMSYFTQPGTVQPWISNERSNSSVRVSWSKPLGEVDRYEVYLNSSTSPPQIRMLQSSVTSYLFENLPAGHLYSAMVMTYIGPVNASSEFVTTATFPNPPGPIEILTKTTSSIDIQWQEAALMAGASFQYQLSLLPSQTRVNLTNTSHTFDSLSSGTSYNISVATNGVMGFVSDAVQIHMVTTMPYNVKDLSASNEEECINVMWIQPKEYKESYRFNLSWQSSDGEVDSVNIKETRHDITNLLPGSPYNVTVTTVTSDGTQGAPRWISTCTNASPVKNFHCDGPNKPNAEIFLSWTKPKGQHSDFRVALNDSEIAYSTTTSFNHTVSNLLHDTVYKLTVVTLSCGEPSTPESLHCRTGITNPPIPEEQASLVNVSVKSQSKFSLQINPQLLNGTNGPITNVGVLVTSNLPSDTSDLRQYLGKTYEQWIAKETPVYLATVTDTIIQSRSGDGALTIEVGDESTWKGYRNGALAASGSYQYAIVIFSKLSLTTNKFVDAETSLVSITNFYIAVKLLPIPVAGIAIGATLGIFSFLFIVLIGFIIYWRRMSKKESPDIQIHSLRVKVSMAVRMEDYEAYYKKQKADSNCGFAEEFEDLKIVGTDQAKTSALILENKPKNRYNNVLPYDSSRVKLSIIHGSPYDDYINANYMPGYNSKKEFIAAQGPLPATVKDFWRMIWEKNVQTLVMLTRCNEQGRVKCEQYWDSGTKHFENITVTTTSEIPLEDWTIRDFDIKNVKTAETRTVRHFHFTAWPDHGVPETTELLISFRHLVREHMDQYSQHSPTVVHCSAGVGRTGTFVAIDRLIFQIERENIVDVFGIVHDLRMHRPLMVQTEDQYVFLNQCAMDIIRSRTGTNVDLIYQNTAALSIYENVEPKRGYPKNGYRHS